MDSISPTISTSADSQQSNQKLKKMVNEFVGVAFFQPMLKAAHNSALKGKYGHGGRGEEIFQGQLDLEIARNMGRGVTTGLVDAMYRKFGGTE